MKRLSVSLTVLLLRALPATRVGLQAADKRPTKEAQTLRVVVHVNFGDAARQGHGLKNVENVLKAVHGKAEVEVVCHGAGLALLVKSQTKHADKVGKLLKQGVRFAACENTMREKSVSKADLLTGTTTVPSGAVEVIRKQNEGYAYFKP